MLGGSSTPAARSTRSPRLRAVIDQILSLRLRSQRHLVRVQEQTRAGDGSARVLLKGPPEALRRLEGYCFASDGGETFTLVWVRLVPPPDGGEAWLALAEARPGLEGVTTLAAPADDRASTPV